MGFLTVLGIVFLLIIIRVIWLSTIPGATPKYDTDSTIRINGEVITPNTPKYKSIARMCEAYNCRIDNLRYTILSNLQLHTLDVDELNGLLGAVKRNKMEEALKFRIKPEETGSAFMETWILQELGEIIQHNSSQFLS